VPRVEGGPEEIEAHALSLARFHRASESIPEMARAH